MAAAKKTGAKYLVHLARDIRTPGAKHPVWADVFELAPDLEAAQAVPREERWVGFQLMGIYELAPRIQAKERLPETGIYESAAWTWTLAKVALDKCQPPVV